MAKIKFAFAIFLATSVAVGTWYLTRPVAYQTGAVEKQIHHFGPQLTLALAQTSAFTKTADGYQPKPAPPAAPAGLKPQEAQAWTAFAQIHGGDAALVPTFPEHYSDGTQVRTSGMSVSLHPLGSNAASAQVENGKLVYHDAYQSTDSLNVVSEGKSEEFLLLRDAQAPQRFEYDLSAVSGVTDITLEDNAIHFTNAQGEQMQIEAPWLIESGGQKSATAVHWEISYPNGDSHPRLALVVADASKLHYPVVIDPSWTVTGGHLSTAREFHTATLLNNGLVLVAGGMGSAGALRSAELYNPATGTFASAGNMSVTRYNHTATLLPNGKVLVAGGYNGSYLATSELYNPVTNSWAATGNLTATRGYHTATLLPNGLVLVAGGLQSGTALATAEIYTPSSGTWASTGGMHSARLFHTATLLPSGAVLVAGGSNNKGIIYNTAELYNNGTWSTTSNLGSARSLHTATLMSNGQVLVTGGFDGSTYLATAESYSPSSGSWSLEASMANARQSHTASLLPNGDVMVTGGLNASGIVSSVEVYNFSASSWSPVLASNLNTARENHTATILPSGDILVVGGTSGSILATAELSRITSPTWAATGSLTTGRVYQTATLLPNGRVLVAGGYAGSGLSAELFNPATGSWVATGSLTTAREYHTATLLPNGQVLVAGGSDSNSNSLATAELFNPATGSWAATGSLTTARKYHTATLLPNGQVLVEGGVDFSANNLSVVSTAELFNPATGSWTATGSLTTGRVYQTATLLPNGQVLVAGGQDSNGHVLSTAELFNPATGSWTATGSLTTGRVYQTATLLPNGQVLVAGGQDSNGQALSTDELFNPATGSWAATGSLTTARESHTATLLPNGQVLAAGGTDSGTLGGIVASAELFNPATGSWAAAGSMTTARAIHTATLLPNGQVLVAGGEDSNGNALATAELFNPGLGYTSATQPQLSAVSSASSTSALALTGSNFTGVSEGSGGNTENSASNIPVVQLEFLGNEQVINVPLSSSSGFTSSAFTSLNVTGGVPGYALLTMFVNGTPSISQIISYTQSAQTISSFPMSQALSQSASPVTLTAKTSDNMTITYTVQSGPATVSGDTLTFTGPGTVVLVATAAGDSTYAPLNATDTITVTAPPQIATDTPTLPQWGLGLLALLLMWIAGGTLFHRRPATSAT